MLYKLPVNVFLRTFGGRQILIQVQILPLITWLTRFLNLSLLVYKMGGNYTRHTTYNLKHIVNGYKMISMKLDISIIIGVFLKNSLWYEKHRKRVLVNTST